MNSVNVASNNKLTSCRGKLLRPVWCNEPPISFSTAARAHDTRRVIGENGRGICAKTAHYKPLRFNIRQGFNAIFNSQPGKHAWPYSERPVWHSGVEKLIMWPIAESQSSNQNDVHLMCRNVMCRCVMKLNMPEPNQPRLTCTKCDRRWGESVVKCYDVCFISAV